LASPPSDPTTADLAEAWLVSLDDDDWRQVAGTLGVLRERNGPFVTGDPEIDELEREIWEEAQAVRRQAGRAS